MLTLLAATPPQPNPYLEPSMILTYVLIVIGIITIIIMLLHMLRFGERWKYKELSYSILVDTPLISVDTRAEREKIHVFYDQQEVKNIYLALLKVWSSGTLDVEIYRRDEKPTNKFEAPYWFVFSGRTIVARSVSETDPPGFIDKDELETYKQNPDPRADAISLPHCLLKPKRTFTIRILLTGAPGEIKTEGQLVNCELKQYTPISENKGIARAIRIFSTALSLVLLLTFAIFSIVAPTQATTLLAPVTGVVAVTIGYYFGSSSSDNSERVFL